MQICEPVTPSTCILRTGTCKYDVPLRTAAERQAVQIFNTRHRLARVEEEEADKDKVREWRINKMKRKRTRMCNKGDKRSSKESKKRG